MPAAAMEEVAHGLEVIERNAGSQTKLIEDLLDVSRITTGKLRLGIKPVDLGPIVRAAVDAVRPAIEAKQITLDPQPRCLVSLTVRRPRPAAAGILEPALQRGEVHAGRRAYRRHARRFRN